jgi:hypothetical protein
MQSFLGNGVCQPIVDGLLCRKQTRKSFVFFSPPTAFRCPLLGDYRCPGVPFADITTYLADRRF